MLHTLKGSPMKVTIHRFLAIGLPLASLLVATLPVLAQIVPDNTLGTQVTQTDLVFGINNGTRSGSNLFHSFSQFSVPTGGSAIFNNATDVQNIFGRITGSQLSNIDGILKTQGGANLFLMNPNGIIFGPNARLELGGSFLGTTATGIKFADGIEFNTLNTAPALLSVNVPIGLQMGTVSGAIEVNGNGHTLVTLLPRSIPLPTQRDPNNTGLTLNSRKTLALISADLHFTGGILTNEQGRIELGAVRSGTIGLTLQADQNFGFNYSNAITHGNLRLEQRSLVDVSGMTGGSIGLQGQNLSFTGGSTVLNQNLGSQEAGITRLTAIDSIQLQDATAATQTTLRSESLGSGTGSQIELNAKNLKINLSASIDAATYTTGKIGAIQINVIDKVEVNGFSPFAPFVPSSIGSANYENGKASQVNIKTAVLHILAGGVIAPSAFGINQGSDLNVQASEILVSGLNPTIQLPSTIATTTFGPGNSGNLSIDADRISVQGVGIIASSTLAQGSAGKLTIRASEWVEVNGSNASINSSADRLSPIFQQAFGLPAIPSGGSGDLNIQTPQIRILNGGEVSVRSDGPGRAGNLSIVADAISLNNRGHITASTVSGNGGNIELNVKSSLILQNESMIANDSFGIGNGGATRINAPTIVGLGNSDIEANSIQGSGGNIQITTQGIFGLKYRTALTSDNDITASSEFGINGSVQVNSIGINSTSTLNSLPSEVNDSSLQMTDRCDSAKTSSFIATGRGGMPHNPMKKLGSDRTWNDLRTNAVQGSAIAPPIAQRTHQPIVEATAFQIDESGSIALVAPNPISATIAATCGMAGSIETR
jgi:filamentous hemagglutinin family protein